MSNIEATIENWWKPFQGEVRPNLTKRVHNTKIVDAVLNGADILGVDLDSVKTLMRMMLPKKATDPSKISYFADYNKYNAGQVKHRVATSPGKFFRKVFPDSPDQLCEAFAAFYQNSITFDVSDYILEVGSTKEDFRKAFRSYFRTQAGFDYFSGKSISDSCMRHAFSDLAEHPSVVYASGDFIVAKVVSKTGKTRARCVIAVRGEEFSAGPVYASCNYSKQLLLDYLKTINNTGFSWQGQKLLKIPSGKHRQTFLCPYVDYCREVCVYDQDYLVLGTYTSWESNSTYGYVRFYDPENKKTWATGVIAKLL